MSLRRPSRIFLWTSTLIFLFLVGCVRRGPTPEAVPLDELAEQAETPERAASMRLVQQGKKELEQSRSERAAHQFTQAIEVDDRNPFAYYYLGLARRGVGRFKEGAALFGRAADLFTAQNWSAEAMAQRGECLESLKQLPQAKATYAEALDRDPSNPRARAGAERLTAPLPE